MPAVFEAGATLPRPEGNPESTDTGRSSRKPHFANFQTSATGETGLKTADTSPSSAVRSPLAVFARLTQAIARTERLEDVFQAALDALAEGLGVERASVLLFGSDGVMRFAAWRGLSSAYRTAVEGHTPWSPHQKGAEPIVVADVQQDTDLAPHLPTISAEHIGAMAFIPLEGVKGVLGKFMLYYSEPHELSSDDLQLARVIAAQIAFAVERTEAYRAARANGERLSFALDAARMGTWDWNLRTQSVRWSGNMERIHGLVPGTSTARSKATSARYTRTIVSECMHPSSARSLVPQRTRWIRIVAPDGTIRWVEGKGRNRSEARRAGRSG